MNRFLTSITLSLAVLFVLAGYTAAAGNVFSFGSNGSGQTGLGYESGVTTIALPIDTSILNGLSVKQVAAGFGHSLLLATDGSVYSFGSNGYGRTGLGTDDGSTLVPTPIDSSNLDGRRINQVAAGVYQSLLLAEDGNVFLFGHYSQERIGGRGSGTRYNSVATPIDTTNLGGRKITQVSAGGEHGLLLADDGSVFSFGWNYPGRTGLGLFNGFTTDPMPIDTSNLGGLKITQIAALGARSLLLAEDGSVYSFGSDFWGHSGRSGIDTAIATPIVTHHLNGAKIKQIAAGARHSLLLADDGTVFSFGSNDRGLTGLGMSSGETFWATPIETSNLGGRTISHVAGGYYHSLLLAEDGTVFSFGWNLHGLTGLGATDGFTSIATQIDMTHLTGRQVVGLSAGGLHSLLLTVPEPGSVSLVAVAFLGFVGMARRMQKRIAGHGGGDA